MSKKKKRVKGINNTGQSANSNIALIKRLERLLKNNNINDATDHILKHFQSMDTTDDKLSELIYEHYIRTDESLFFKRFNKNLEILKRYEAVFPELNIVFEDIKKKTFTYHGWSLLREKEIIINKSETDSSLLLIVDLINLDVIKGYIGGRDCLYLTYDDLRNFYYILLFKDLSKIEEAIKEGKIVFLVCNDNDVLMNFFSNMMVQPPNHGIDKSKQRSYGNRINEVVVQLTNQKFSYLERLNDYYKNLDYNYYKDLFLKEPNNIKILLPTPQRTTANKFITKNWYNAFLDLGYNAEYQIDKKPYEHLTVAGVWKKIYEFKPDIVFDINYTVDWLTPHENKNAIINNLLWIMRYRDYGKYAKTDNNMFVLPFVKRFIKHINEDIGIANSRILYTADGVDTKLFNINRAANNRYVCDIVSVNNKVGNEDIEINAILGISQNEIFQKTIFELCNEIKEIAFSGEVLAYDSPKLRKMITEKLIYRGFSIKEVGMQFIAFHLSIISDTFNRQKVMEWIIDSNITKSIKVWGNGWHNIEKFRKFDMGLAKYDELPHIYQNSRIALSNTHGVYLHERNFEILASSGFPLIKHMGDDFDEYNITDYFKENNDIILYYNKNDLLNKIQYYLDNPHERDRIANNGKNIVCQQFTNTAIAKKTMDFIKNYYHGNSKCHI